MQQWERELYVARIIAGKIRIRVNDTTLYVVGPTPEHRQIAAEVYRDARRDAELDGALSDEELEALLIKERLWTNKDTDTLEKLGKAIEDLKVGLFENRLRSNAKVTIRSALKKTRDEMTRLENIRHGLDYVTIDGLAIAAKYRYLTGACIRYQDGMPYWTDDSWHLSDPLIDKVMEITSYERLQEKEFRELSRTEPWRTIWGARGFAGKGVFGCAAIEMTDDQRNISLWSSIYDNIREYPDCPNNDVMADDDMLDGWMVIQRRKRESQSASQEATRIGNEKIRNADEQFIFVDSVDDAKEVEKMNDEMAAANKRQRMEFLKQKGEVNEVHMPDTAKRLRMEMNKMEQMTMRQIRGK